MNDKVAVVGAGIIGLACAFELQRRGHQVTLIDTTDPMRGCSYGNAGIIATSESLPLITMKRVLSFPAMLLQHDAPAVVRARSLPRFLPWFARASMTLSRSRQKEIAEALAVLNRQALPAWRSMLSQANRPDLLLERGMIELARTKNVAHEFIPRAQILNSLGLRARLLSPDDILDLEPNLGTACLGGILHEDTAHVTNPFDVGIALLDGYLALGGVLRKEEVLSVAPADAHIRVMRAGDQQLYDRVLICAGLASAKLMKPLGVKPPLQAERGYHLTLPDAVGALNRPLTFASESCVATPMSGGLRLAGTVEFAEPGADADWRRAERLQTYAERYFAKALPGEGAVKWLGSRPSLPDSLPAIGLLKADPRIGYAFGHQHLGLTQAAVTAQIVADQICGVRARVDAAPYRVERF